MVHSWRWFATLCAPVLVASVSVNIDGVIDLGPKWNYEYSIKSGDKEFVISPESFIGKQIGESKWTKNYDEDSLPKNNYKDSLPKSNYKVSISKSNDKHSLPRSDVKHFHLKSNLMDKLSLKIDEKSPYTDYKTPESKIIYEKPHAVKEDTRINDFSFHVYKQSLKVFDEIKKKLNPDIKSKVDLLARNYDEKFRAFINETLEQKIKTRLGTQKVVLNIIDTSNRLLKRLVNYFIGDMTRQGVLRNNMAAANVFEKEVDRECELEMKHACTKFGICRTTNGFSNFIIDFLKIIIKSEDRKVKQAADALTEVLKNTDFSKVMNARTKKNFIRTIENVELYDTKMVRAVFKIAKNVLALKNRPINVMVMGSDHINKTVAFLEIVDEFDKQLPPNEENKLEWHDITISLSDWSDGKRDDILEIMQGLVSFVKKRGIKKLDARATESVRDKLEMIYS